VPGSEWVATGRADVNRHWLLEVEVHFVNGTAQLSPLDNPDDHKKDWTLFAAKTTIGHASRRSTMRSRSWRLHLSWS
jgi:hypothetical protein